MQVLMVQSRGGEINEEVIGLHVQDGFSSDDGLVLACTHLGSPVRVSTDK